MDNAIVVLTKNEPAGPTLEELIDAIKSNFSSLNNTYTMPATVNDYYMAICSYTDNDPDVIKINSGATDEISIYSYNSAAPSGYASDAGRYVRTGGGFGIFKATATSVTWYTNNSIDKSSVGFCKITPELFEMIKQTGNTCQKSPGGTSFTSEKDAYYLVGCVTEKKSSGDISYSGCEVINSTYARSTRNQDSCYGQSSLAIVKATGTTVSLGNTNGGYGQIFWLCLGK